MSKNKNQKRIFKKPVESTQLNVPVDDVIDGLILDENGKYIKILEFKAQPFFLMKPKDQNLTINTFQQMLKTAPNNLHIKTLAIPSDMSEQIKDIQECVNTEKDEKCKKMGGEYLQRLKDVQEYGVTRKFYISFPYEGITKGIQAKSLAEIEYTMENDANMIISMMKQCGNEYIPSNYDNPNVGAAELLYNIYNRNESIEHPFVEHWNEVYNKYAEAAKGKEFNIPVKDLISPIRISYENKKFMYVNDTCYSFLYIPEDGYNEEVTAGWLNRFISTFVGVDVDIFLKRVPTKQVIHGIKRAIANARMDLSEVSDTTDSYDASAGTLQSALYLKNRLANGEDFYYMTTVITVSGKDPKEVSHKIEQLKKRAEQVDIKLKENTYRCEETFNMVLPFSMWDNKFTFKKCQRNILASGAAGLYPFTSYQLMDKKGLYIADDYNGSPVILDLFDRKKLNNPHVFICGETGAGKSVTLMLLTLRARVRHIPVLILAPEKEDEYRRACEAIGGQFISYGAGSSQRMNIFDIFMRSEQSDENKKYLDGSDDYMQVSYLAEKLSTLLDFFKILIPDITPEEKQLLNDKLINLYDRFGITSQNDSLWADETHTKYKTMPIMQDLVDDLIKDPETKRLSRIIKILTSGAGQYFNGHTNVNINSEFFVIGLEHNSKDFMSLAIFQAMDFCLTKIREDRLQKKIFVMDEWWKMAFNPVAAEKSLEIAKLVRAYNCSMVIATQQMSDILAIEDGKYGKAVLGNCATNILMKMKESDAQIVSEMVDLTDREEEQLKNYQAGQALLLAGKARMQLQFMPSETEKLLTFTNEETLNKYIQLKKDEEIKNDKNYIAFDDLKEGE